MVGEERIQITEKTTDALSSESVRDKTGVKLNRYSNKECALLSKAQQAELGEFKELLEGQAQILVKEPKYNQ